MDVQETIRNAPLFAQLPKKDLKHLAAALTEQTSRRAPSSSSRASPASASSSSPGSATVKVKGKTIRTWPGEHFGEVALIDDGPRMAEINAETDLECFALPAWQFRAFIKDHPDVAWALMQSLVKRIVRDAEGDEQP